MDAATIQRLNHINREFYRITARNFDQTRGQPWPGWERVAEQLRADVERSGSLAVLDVGCGNGRFGLFLYDRFIRERAAAPAPGSGWQYHGLDSSPALLERARAELTGLPGWRVTLQECDVIEQPPDAGAYDLVALFGLLHHVPGYAGRQAFVRRVAERVKPGGLLVFACWRFIESERLRARIQPWPPGITVEPGDYLLDWRRGETALRYCHYVDDAEHAALVAAAGLGEVAGFRADGDEGRTNRYSLLRK